MPAIPPRSITTNRLLLRPTSSADADRAFDIQTDWEVTRMLRLVPFPPDIEEIRQWFAGHQREWDIGRAYRFAVVLDGRMIGLADIDTITERQGTLGYWLDRAAWGHGYAFEAAQALLRFAADDIRLLRLKAGHAADNPASGSILTRLGFRPVETVRRFSRPRNADIQQHRYELTFSDQSKGG
jgi:RimJ/RimL family protein N-acetyltransferase